MTKAFRVDNNDLPEALKAMNADYEAGMVRCSVEKVLPGDSCSVVLVSMTRPLPYTEMMWEQKEYGNK